MSKTVSDHLGNIYPSIQAMCDKYGIKRQLYRKRMMLGWTQEQALSTSTLAPSESLYKQEEKSYSYPFANGTVTVREYSRRTLK